MIRVTLRLHRCAQCWKYRGEPSFVGARGKPVNMCAGCRARYKCWDGKSFEDKIAEVPRRQQEATTGRVLWVERSGNKKTGPIPVSISERGTCPPSCGFYDAGCYAAYGKLGSHWKGVADRGLPWDEFLARVRELPEGQLWRHNEAGDLAGDGETLDASLLRDLVGANAGRRGFSFSHKHRTHNDRLLIAWAVSWGFVINLSADTLEQADELASLGLAPVSVLLPHDAPRATKTPAGRPVVTCVAQTTPGVTCADCELCANAGRHSIVGFRGHGQSKKMLPQLVKLRRKEARA
jgi:hypothetical protein